MRLGLDIEGPHGRSQKVLSGRGGTIGRVWGNDVVLPDPEVSARHAFIRYDDDRFCVEAARTHTVAINSPVNRLSSDEHYELRTGDVILIGPFRIRAAIWDAVDDFLTAASDNRLRVLCRICTG